jgi:hypothetical protein
MYIGNHKVENTELFDGVVFPPGRLKDWLRQIATGQQIDIRVPITPDMYTLQGRVAKLDEFGVESCLLFVGLMISTFGWLYVFGEKGKELGRTGSCRCTPITSSSSTSGPSITRTGSIPRRSWLCGISTGRSRKPNG